MAWIDLGDTDTRAHAGDYSGYLAAAAAADAFLAAFWAALQADPRTAGQTTLLVTTDHGRGESARERWRGHGSGRYRRAWVPGIRREGSDAVWFAVRGPAVVAGARLDSACAVSGQVAATLLEGLGVPWTGYRADARPPLAVFRGSDQRAISNRPEAPSAE